MGVPSASFVAQARPYFSGEKETFATVLLGCLLQAYGAEVLHFDPITIEMHVVDDFGVHMPDTVYDQLMALIHILATDSFYHSATVFDAMVSALNGAGAEHGDVPTPEEVAWAVLEAQLNDPDPHGTGAEGPWPFSREICRYVGVVLDDAGLQKAPDVLGFADRGRKAESGDQPDDVAANDENQESMAAQVDDHTQRLLQELISQLQGLGIQPAPALLEAETSQPAGDPLDALLPAGMPPT